MEEILRKSASEQHKMIENKEITATELTKMTLQRISDVDER